MLLRAHEDGLSSPSWRKGRSYVIAASCSHEQAERRSEGRSRSAFFPRESFPSKFGGTTTSPPTSASASASASASTSTSSPTQAHVSFSSANRSVVTLSAATMAEVQFAKVFLATLDRRPVRLNSDFVSDPRKYPSQTPVCLLHDPCLSSVSTSLTMRAVYSPTSLPSLPFPLHGLRLIDDNGQSQANKTHPTLLKPAKPRPEADHSPRPQDHLRIPLLHTPRQSQDPPCQAPSGRPQDVGRATALTHPS